ncbi:FAD/NAD(P)-binding protein [Microbacterium kribbense]|uniref:FAD/NAD(P)-binding protein n=1 Tax=Microbacterium kribbense TaxID=433645 RepID=UPI0031DB8D38
MAARIALVGVGPRGVAVAARLVADRDALAPGTALTVHLIDGVAVGSGRTWRPDQSPYLLNNTYCAETTVFADETVPTTGPTGGGPSLAAWTQQVAAHPDAFADDLVREASAAHPWSFPSRRLQGAYYRWALHEVIARAPGDVTFLEHVGTVVALDDAADGAQLLTLADGTAITVDVVVLAQGLLTSDASTEALSLAAQASAHDVTYVAPGMPAERDWARLPAGERVIMRGLGANFFDLIGVLFEGRGGRFERAADGRLRYLPSGREPVVSAGSRRGLPYRGKAYYPDGLPAPIELARFSATRERDLLRAHAGRADVDAGVELLADIRADFRDLFEAAASARGLGERFDWPAIVFPAAGRTFDDEAAWEHFLDDYFTAELDRIHHPDTNPHKIVHRAMETARRRLARLVLAQVIDPASVVRDLQQSLLPDGLVLASGPPPERVERLIALRAAGLIEILGPGIAVEIGPGAVTATTAIPGQLRHARVLAEARMTLGNLRTCDDPLVRHLVTTGQARFHRVDAADAALETNTLDVTGDGFLMVDASGRPHPHRVVLGPPAGDVQFYSAIGAVPHTGDKMLAGADIAASHALRVVAGLAPPVCDRKGPLPAVPAPSPVPG